MVTLYSKETCQLIGDLLDQAADEFANHGCNDISIPDTPENRALVEKAQRWSEPEGDEEDLAVQIGKDGQIHTHDFLLMSYFANMFKEEAK